MKSMQWQLGILGTIPAFASRHRETKKNMCRGGRSQDLPNTDFQPTGRHLKYKKKQQCAHSATNTHKMTTMHTRQLQHTRPTNNKYTQHNLKLATIHTRQIRIEHVQKVKRKNFQVRKQCLQFLLIFFSPIISSLTLSRQSFTSHHLLLL